MFISTTVCLFVFRFRLFSSKMITVGLYRVVIGINKCLRNVSTFLSSRGNGDHKNIDHVFVVHNGCVARQWIFPVPVSDASGRMSTQIAVFSAIHSHTCHRGSARECTKHLLWELQLRQPVFYHRNLLYEDVWFFWARQRCRFPV